MQIRKLIDEWATAFRAKNIDGLMANHSPDIVLFDVPSPLQYRGADAYRKKGPYVRLDQHFVGGGLDCDADAEERAESGVAGATAIETRARVMFRNGDSDEQRVLSAVW